MKINKKELLKGLEVISPALAKKSFIKNSMDFIFTGKNILAYNDQICIFYPFISDFACAIPSDEFYKIIYNIPYDEIDIIIKENKLIILTKDIEANIICDSIDSILNIINNLEIDNAIKYAKELPSNFIEALQFCAFSTARYGQNESLKCLLIEDEFISSTDGYRISEYKMQDKIDISILLPVYSANELIKCNVNKYYLSGNGGWIYFFTDNGIYFCSRLVNNDFPQYLSFFNDFQNIPINIPSEIENNISIIEVMASGTERLEKEIEVEIFNNKWILYGRNDLGWIKKEIIFNNKNIENIKFKINPYFFKEIISKTKTMFLSNDKIKILFKNNDFKHVLALRQ